jgi:hypothetical protein
VTGIIHASGFLVGSGDSGLVVLLLSEFRIKVHTNNHWLVKITPDNYTIVAWSGLLISIEPGGHARNQS